jgi:Protein of unknown function (DUF1552)
MPKHSRPVPRALSRRAFLRGAGVAVALPLLDAMRPAFAGGRPDVPRRMLAVETNMGILPQFFFPEKAGTGYALTPYLERLAKHRDQFTVFSGVSLPGVTGAHAAEKCFLTGTPHPERGGFRNGVSLDQFAAETLGTRTRYSSLVLGVGSEGQTLSYTRSGAPIPVERSPRKLFEKLFVQGKASEVEARTEDLRQGRSTLDFVGEQAKRLNGSLAPADRQRLDQYLTSVRELEQRLATAQAWEKKPKPKVTAAPPEDVKDGREFARQTAILFDVVRLALETDSARLFTLFIDATSIHDITHHGNRPEVLASLRAKEEAQLDVLAGLLKGLTEAKEGNDTLLDRTMVLYGTCMGSANSHANTNLPVLLAGGGFKHGRHLAFDKENNYPLTNLYVSMLQRLGLEVGEFSSGKGTMRGLEMV